MDVQTTRGLMNDADLEKRDGATENAEELVTWVEYWFEGQLVHRSVHVTKKHPIPGLSAIVGRIG
jgi:hypothetical protein